MMERSGFKTQVNLFLLVVARYKGKGFVRIQMNSANMGLIFAPA